MQSNMRKRIFHNKIGAKYTGRMQPCDLGQSFRIMKSKSRTATLKDQESPLTTSLVNGMKKMKSSKRLLLPERKQSAILDCCATSPNVKGAAYSSASIKTSFIIPGMINKLDGCPAINATMSASNINLQTN